MSTVDHKHQHKVKTIFLSLNTTQHSRARGGDSINDVGREEEGHLISFVSVSVV